MLVSMLVRCEQCGHESAPRYHYCGMCGAKLPPPEPPPPLPPLPEKPAPAAEKPATEPVVRQVSGPSFLGLADEPTSSVSYLLEDEYSESHWGRSVVLLLVLIGIGFAGWHWRGQLRTYVESRLAQHPTGSQSEQASPSEAPGSEVGAGMPGSATAAEKPMTGVGDLPPNPTTAQSPTGAPAAQPATPNPTALPTASAPAPTQNASAPATAGANAANGSAPGAPASSTVPAQPTATPAPAETAENAGPNAASATPVASTTPTPAVTKHARPRVKQTAPAPSDADQLESQGEKYLYGTGAPASCSLAEKSLQAAAERGSGKADSVLGTMYATGHCVGRDLPLAYRWFAKALAQDPSNDRLQRDLQVLWNQMTSEERQIAMRR